MWGEKGVPELIAAWTVIINYFTVLASLELDIDAMPNMVVSVATLYWQICYSVWKSTDWQHMIQSASNGIFHTLYHTYSICGILRIITLNTPDVCDLNILP